MWLTLIVINTETSNPAGVPTVATQDLSKQRPSGSALRRVRNRVRRAIGLRPLGDPSRLGRPGGVLEPDSARRFEHPGSGTELAPGLSLFHDAQSGEYSVTQQSPLAWRFTIYQFDGTYLSLAQSVDDAADFVRHGVCGLDFRLTANASRPLPAHLRLNLKGAEREEMLYDGFVIDHGPRTAHFDLHGADLPGLRLHSAWIDVIFSQPQMVEFDLIDIAVEAVR